MTIIDTDFPKCAALGILRRTNHGYLCVSTTAMHRKLGWTVYEKFLPLMRHKNNGFVTPESAEAFLRTLAT